MVQADGTDAADRGALHPQVRRGARRLQIEHAVLHGGVQLGHGFAGDANPPVATLARMWNQVFRSHKSGRFLAAASLGCWFIALSAGRLMAYVIEFIL